MWVFTNTKNCIEFNCLVTSFFLRSEWNRTFTLRSFTLRSEWNILDLCSFVFLHLQLAQQIHASNFILASYSTVYFTVLYIMLAVCFVIISLSPKFLTVHFVLSRLLLCDRSLIFIFNSRFQLSAFYKRVLHECEH